MTAEASWKKLRGLHGEKFQWATVDPGLSGTGFAVWDGEALAYSGAFSPDRLSQFEARCNAIRLALLHGLPNQIDVLFYENPQALQNACASGGGLVKLSKVAGVVLAVGCQIGLHVPCGVEIPKWKGNTPKALMTKRILARMNKKGWKPTTKKGHETDAVGMGLYLLGEL